jgi:hypothetical protein
MPALLTSTSIRAKRRSAISTRARAFTREFVSDRLAYAASGAGDDYDFILKKHCRRSR